MKNRTSLAAIGVLAGLALCALAAEVPRPAPAVSYPTTTGKAINLASYKGKVVALQFLLTTCPHCKDTSKLLQKMYEEFGSRGFQPVGVATDDGVTPAAVNNYISSEGLSWPVGYTKREEVHKFLQMPLMQIMYVPQLVFIDRNGVIQGQYGGLHDPFFDKQEANMRATIQKLLDGEKLTSLR